MNLYEQIIAKTRYSRWRDSDQRREDWPETVGRYFDFLADSLRTTHGFNLSGKVRRELEEAVRDLDIVPSMRLLATAGPAAERCNVCAYNCAYLPVDSARAFDETLYILMCGTGVGFSVERQYVSQLPVINEHFEQSDTEIIVADSKSGWARGLRELVSLLYSGQIPRWNLSKLRPAGARLKTFGGRSSGPEPLEALFNFVTHSFRGAAGRRLTSLECHDIMCKIGEVVVVGGVRRSALISLSNVSDLRMQEAKSGQWWLENPQRALSNNSACYTETPELLNFIDEWRALIASRSGERGIFNRVAAKKQAAKNGRRSVDFEFGTNPCSEIILRGNQFCNLTEVVVRAGDSPEVLRRKVRLATVLGTFQSTLTDFKYLRSVWKQNCEDERLLGVSLTGILDHESLGYDEELLADLRNVCIDTNLKLSNTLGINQSAAITCVKPSGTVSQLVGSASGLHPRHSSYYIRNIRSDLKDPVTTFLKDKGIPGEQDGTNGTAWVFSFPIHSPEGARTRGDITALEHLDIWRRIQDHWCEHKPSITVSVRESEWLDVSAWVYRNFDEVSGIAFLPYDDHVYKQAPYIECTKSEYEKLLFDMPTELDWNELQGYEKEDNTIASQEMACVGNSCEI